MGQFFEYVYSLSRRHEWFWFFQQYTSNMPVDNGSSPNITTGMKIIAYANIIVSVTSVLAVYLLVHYLIFNFPLLCTSSWRFEIRLPPMYNLIEFSPDDQITPKLFSSLNSTNIDISSYKRMLNRSIAMEVRFNTFPFSCWCE